MKINRNELIKSLKQATAGTGKDDLFIKGSETLLLDSKFIHSYNDEISVSVPFDFDGGVPVTIKAKEFINVLSKLSTKEIDIVFKKDKLSIKAGKTRVNFKTNKNYISDYKNLLAIDTLKWEFIFPNFINILNFCLLNNMDTNLNGVYFNNKYAYSTDRVSLCRYDIDNKFEDFLISSQSVNEIRKIKDIESIAFLNDWIHLKTSDNLIFSVKLLNHINYPVDKIKKGVCDKNEIAENDIQNELPDDFFNAVGRVSSMSSISDLISMDVIKIQICKDKLVLFSVNEYGDIKESLDWKKPFVKDIKNVTFEIPIKVIDNRIVDNCQFYLKVSEKNVLLIFESENWKYFISGVLIE